MHAAPHRRGHPAPGELPDLVEDVLGRAGRRTRQQQGESAIAQAGGDVAGAPCPFAQQPGQAAGVGLARFDELSVLEKVGENRYRNTSNAQPQPAMESVIQQGMLEGSNVKPVSEITRMIEITRTYESVAKMMDANAELSRRSIERMGKVN